MIGVKEAVAAAQQYVRELYSKTDLKHLRLEEVELSEDERYWYITLGWAESGVRLPTSLSAVLSSEVHVLPRVYKTFEIDAQTGAVKSMKIREVA